MVLPVSAEIGFMVMLPHSLYQMSQRMRVEQVTSKPAVVNKSEMDSTRRNQRG